MEGDYRNEQIGKYADEQMITASGLPKVRLETLHQCPYLKLLTIYADDEYNCPTLNLRRWYYIHSEACVNRKNAKRLSCYLDFVQMSPKGKYLVFSGDSAVTCCDGVQVECCLVHSLQVPSFPLTVAVPVIRIFALHPRPP